MEKALDGHWKKLSVRAQAYCHQISFVFEKYTTAFHEALDLKILKQDYCYFFPLV